MSFFNRLRDALFSPREEPATQENIEKWANRAMGWVIRCNKCGWEDLFDKYGSRKKAKGTKRNFGRCPQCKRWTWFVIEKKKEPKREDGK